MYIMYTLFFYAISESNTCRAIGYGGRAIQLREKNNNKKNGKHETSFLSFKISLHRLLTSDVFLYHVTV